jgi:hypothetical protein
MHPALIRAKKILRRLDPNDDPTAEPLSPLAMLVFAIAVGTSAWMFLKWHFQPMQDVGLHASMVAVVTDYGRSGSIYPPIYKPVDWLNTNTLFCVTAGLLGKIFGAWTGMRLTLASYLVFMPLVNLYALRVFGRSAWGAVMAVPFCYNIVYIFGFASFLFATPFAVLSVPLFYRMLVKPSWQRIAAVAACLTFCFLSHWHVYLWTGVLLFLMTFGAVCVTAKRALFGFPSTRPWTVALVAFVSTIPSLLLLARWAYLATKPPADDETTLVQVQGATFKSFVEGIRPPSEVGAGLLHIVDIVKNESDTRWFIAMLLVGGLSMAIARMHDWKRPPILELCCVLTCVSYFLVPENWGGQQIIGSRQLGFGLYFASAFFTPVPRRVSFLGRASVVAAVIWLTSSFLSYWNEMLVKFEREEVNGLEEMIAAAPPKLKMHYVKPDPISKYFETRAFWHVEGMYMVAKYGQVDENPAYSAMQPIRYRKAYVPSRPDAHHNGWASSTEIWQNFDLVLVRKWHPSAADLETAQKFGDRLAKKGDWELWRSRVNQRR